jgi:porin
VWHQSSRFETFGGETQGGTTGFYVMAEHQLWRKGAAEGEADKGLFAWVQYGWADEDVWDIGTNIAGGVTLRGTFEGRDDDSTGVFLSFADLSDAEGSPYEGNETALEVTYRIQVTPAVVIRPDVQFIFDPSGDPTIENAIVGAVRFEVAF